MYLCVCACMSVSLLIYRKKGCNIYTINKLCIIIENFTSKINGYIKFDFDTI